MKERPGRAIPQAEHLVRADGPPNRLKLAAAAVVLAVVFLWSYWPNLLDLWQIWHGSDEYSVGLIVPFLAAYIFWSRRHHFSDVPIGPSLLTGSLLFLAAIAFRFFGQFLMFGSAERFSIGLSIVGIFVMMLGRHLAVRNWDILLFLFLMLPWPNRVQASIAYPLQEWATASSVFSLEMLGYNPLREGNVIHIGDSSVAVAEACNGLRMVTAFIVISALVALLAKREWWEKIILLLASLPIALLCNTIRLTITAIAFTFLEGEVWQEHFHDFGGYAMMPVGLAATVGLLWLITKLTVVQDEVAPAVVLRRGGDSSRQVQAAGRQKV